MCFQDKNLAHKAAQSERVREKVQEQAAERVSLLWEAVALVLVAVALALGSHPRKLAGVGMDWLWSHPIPCAPRKPGRLRGTC